MDNLPPPHRSPCLLSPFLLLQPSPCPCPLLHQLQMSSEVFLVSSLLVTLLCPGHSLHLLCSRPNHLHLNFLTSSANCSTLTAPLDLLQCCPPPLPPPSPHTEMISIMEPEHMPVSCRCIKKLSSSPINLEYCEPVPEWANTSRGQSDGTGEQTAHKLMGLL